MLSFRDRLQSTCTIRSETRQVHPPRTRICQQRRYKSRVDAKHREGYQDLEYFIQNGYEGEFGIVVVHVHDFSGHVPPGSGKEAGRNILESPELVRDRLLYAAKVVGDPAKIWANPDCALRTRTWDVTLAKLISTVKGAELAREASR